MTIEQWNEVCRNARKKADSAYYRSWIKCLSDEELEFALNNKYPGSGIWADGFLNEVKKEIENRVANILLE